jgi:Zn-dependent peptidase ImmA (M78 family)/transcriptional regulator with XRE-family HTH domain
VSHTARNGGRAPNPDIITVARESRGLTQTDLAPQIGVSQGLLSKIEAGKLVPGDDVINALARALDYPESFFFSSERIYGPSTSEFFHRKRAEVSVRAIDKIHAHLNIRHIQIARMIRSVEVPVNIPRLDPDEFEGDVDEIARAVRAGWQIPRGPVRDVVGVIEDAGGIVIRSRFDTNKVDAVSWWVPGEPPIFLVNDAMPADRERMTLCHELGHLVMHTNVRPEMENEANRFAAALLMPAEDVRQDLYDVTMQSLATLKAHWRVSMAALLKRATDIGTLHENRARYLWMQMSRAGYRTREPAELDFPKESPALLQELVDTHVEELGYEVEQFSNMIGWTEQEALANYSFKSRARDPRDRFRVLK